MYTSNVGQKDRDIEENLTKTENCGKMNHRLVIVLMGIPGAGKGTQGLMLSKKYQIPHLAIGEIIREQEVNQTPIGKLITLHHQNNEKRSPDEIAIGIIAKKIAEPDCARGFILDGFPRTKGQCVTLLNTLLKEKDIHVPILLDVSFEESYERLKKRFICITCAKVIRAFDQVEKEGFCPYCSSQLIQRDADTSHEKLKQRVVIFKEKYKEISQLIEKRDPIRVIKTSSQEEPVKIFERVDEGVQQRLCEEKK